MLLILKSFFKHPDRWNSFIWILYRNKNKIKSKIKWKWWQRQGNHSSQTCHHHTTSEATEIRKCKISIKTIVSWISAKCSFEVPNVSLFQKNLLKLAGRKAGRWQRRRWLMANRRHIIWSAWFHRSTPRWPRLAQNDQRAWHHWNVLFSSFGHAENWTVSEKVSRERDDSTAQCEAHFSRERILHDIATESCR